VPKWRLLEPHYVEPTGEGVRHCAAGKIIEHSGPPSLSMIPLDAAARAILAQHEEQRGVKQRHWMWRNGLERGR
jgi:hypothetical protein